MKRRKLFSFTGYRGFIAQLAPDEVLIFEYSANARVLYKRLETYRDYKFTETVDAQCILGFWAYMQSATNRLAYSEPVDIRKYSKAYSGSSVRRPVEDLVFAAIMSGVPAVSLVM